MVHPLFPLQVYTHAKSKAVEFMIVDALLEADAVMGFSGAIRSAADFVHLDDSLLRTIEEYHLLTRCAMRGSRVKGYDV